MYLSVRIIKKLDEFILNVKFETDSEVMALLGASGSGKSVTLKCVAGLITPDRGRIVLNGRVLYDSDRRIDLPPQKRNVGYLFQEYALFPHMTVRQNLLAAVRRLPRERRGAAVDAMLRTFRIEALETQYPRQLSGGQQQRVALARAMASEPELLLLDEPFSALDGYLRWQLELELPELLKSFDGDMLLVTHDRGEAARLCDSVVVLSDGHSEPKCAMDQLMTAPGTVSAALISGCKNFSRAHRADVNHVRCDAWGAVLQTFREVPPNVTYVGIHDRALHIALSGERNRFYAHVVRVIEDVYTVVLMLSPEGGSSLLRMELPRARWEALDDPDTLLLSVSPEEVMLLTGDLG